ncbi:hypothetical protein ACGFK1_09500 [Mycobacterium sp. NPDC048908]
MERPLHPWRSGGNPGDGLPLGFVLLTYVVTDLVFIALPVFFSSGA